jgi:Rieske Fe-S protein
MSVDDDVVETRERRRFLKAVIGIAGATIAAITVIPCVAFVVGPAFTGGRRRRRKVIFQSPSDSASPTFVPARYEGQEETAPGIFVRFDKGKPIVLSAQCTHAACAVAWNAAEKKFICPCHQGQYDASGKNIAGPPPRPLEALEATGTPGQLYVLEPEA